MHSLTSRRHDFIQYVRTQVTALTFIDSTRTERVVHLVASGKRLLYVVNDSDFFVSHRLIVARCAREAGFEVHVASPTGSAVRRIREDHLEHHPYKISRSGRNPLAELSSFFQLFWTIKRIKPDIVHLVTIKPVVYGGLIARILAVPFTVAAISGLGYVFTNPDNSRILRFLIIRLYRIALRRRSVCTIFQNSQDVALFEKLGIIEERNARLIPGSGVDTEVFKPIAPPDSSIVILAARLLRDKGIREFAKAAELIKSQHPATRFVLVGDIDPGNPSSLSRAEVDQWVNAGTLEYWGFRQDMPNVLSQARIVVLPSYREGMPKILAEAAAMGIAVVTTDVPGCRDSVLPDVTGLVVPARDAVSLSEAIAVLLDDPARCLRMGAAGREHALKTFASERIVQMHLDIYTAKTTGTQTSQTGPTD